MERAGAAAHAQVRAGWLLAGHLAGAGARAAETLTCACTYPCLVRPFFLPACTDNACLPPPADFDMCNTCFLNPAIPRHEHPLVVRRRRTALRMLWSGLVWAALLALLPCCLVALSAAQAWRALLICDSRKQSLHSCNTLV